MRIKGILLMSLAMWPALAKADLTAIYAASDGRSTTTVKVAANGDLQSHRAPGGHVILLRGGQSYIVDAGDGALNIMRVEDLATAIAEHMAKVDPAGWEQRVHLPHRTLFLKGSATIGGRTGDAYYAREADGTVSTKPFIVISHDPTLAPLGDAMARQFEAGEKLSPSGVNLSVLETLRKGTPLVMAALELKSVSTEIIDPTQFDLPGPVDTLDQLRARLAGTQ